MPNSVLPFHINNCKVTPNGINAQMSITGSNSQSNQGTWKNNDNQYDYIVTLPEDAWELAPDQTGVCATADLEFTVTKGNTSCVYQLIGDAPLGASPYQVTRSDGEDCLDISGEPQDPEVIINS